MTAVVICNGLIWLFNEEAQDPLTRIWANPECLGLLPGFLDAADPRPASSNSTPVTATAVTGAISRTSCWRT